MNVPLLKHLAHLIVLLFEHEGPVVEKAAIAGAVEGVQSDPKVQAVTAASVAFLAAARDLKAAADAPSPETK